MTLKPIAMLPTGHPETGFVPSSLVAEADFTTADKTERISGLFANEDESTVAGVWECAPCREEFEAYPVNEMMTVLSPSNSIVT